MIRECVDEELMNIFLDFGECMMLSGAEISRVEDSLSRMGKSYGAEQTDVFVITSSIELTMSFSDGKSVTRTRRILSSVSNDFKKLSRLNALSRQCAVKPMDLEQLRCALTEIQNGKVSDFKKYAGSFLAAAGFCVFFGGTVLDGLVSGIVALFICWMQLKLSCISPNEVFFLFFSSFIMVAGICVANLFLPTLHLDMVIIGDIMLLVPGIAITTAVRDTLIGDTISGITRLADCLMWAMALAAGVMVAMLAFVR